MWRNPTTLAECETALDNGTLYVPVGGGRYWLARRNGATRLWKLNAARFRVPIKYGFKKCGAIDDVAHFGQCRIASAREEAEGSASIATGMGIGKSTVIYSERTENDITAYVEK
jgi:hypothetical protein